MKDLAKQYEAAKKKALFLMQNGHIAAYLNALAEMNTYKSLMTSIVAN